MARMKGAELITEYLIKNKVPYVFGIGGHGNVGMLDSLYKGGKAQFGRSSSDEATKRTLARPSP
jgi:thiamine pyrophosphate-dependent acetolactate synthase large subunit-like protein